MSAGRLTAARSARSCPTCAGVRANGDHDWQAHMTESLERIAEALEVLAAAVSVPVEPEEETK